MGFVYLLFYFPGFFFKIGQTKTPIRRINDINKSVRGQIIIPIGLVWVFKYDDKERYLHKIFNSVRFTFRGSGKTECFRLGLVRLAYCYFLLLLFQFELLAIIAACFVIGYLIII